MKKQFHVVCADDERECLQLSVQIIMGNLMEVEQYAQANTVVSLVGVLSMPTTIITMISARYIALNALNEEKTRIRSVISPMLKGLLLRVGLILAVVILLLLNKITSLFALVPDAM